MAHPIGVRDAFLDDFRSANDVVQSVSALQKWQDEEFDDATIDACLVAACHHAERHEMAGFSRFLAWAVAMGHNEDLDLSS